MNLPDYTNCTLCPRMCHVNRSVTTGYCGCSSHISAARAALHKWEEPVLSGPEEEPGGSGAVFFSGCTLRCCFCQNYQISSEGFGKDISGTRLEEIFLELQEKGQVADLEKIEADIADRDYRDMHRETSPLRQAEDAVLVDSSEMTIEQVVERILSLCR